VALTPRVATTITRPAITIATDNAMILLVCGGRDYADAKTAFATLDAEHAKNPISLLIEGGARGADNLAREWAQQRGIEDQTFMADWKQFGRSAGPRRNQQMIEAKPDMVIAFPGGGGTADMVKRAKKARVPVMEIT